MEYEKTMHEFINGLPSYIIPLQKALPPYMPFKEGYGFMGVTLCDTDKDRIQCHFCGRWFKSLAQHIKVHSIDTNEYKEKVGLYRKESLLSLRTKLKYREALKATGSQLFRDTTGQLAKPEIKASVEQKNTGSTKIEWRNRFGTCEAQLKMRLERAVEKHGGIPTNEQEIDLIRVLRYRFGTFAKALEFYDYSVPERILNAKVGHKLQPKAEREAEELTIAKDCPICGKKVLRAYYPTKIEPRHVWLERPTCIGECRKVYDKSKSDFKN